MSKIQTTSGFALIDVKRGRKALSKIVKDHKFRVPVTLKGYIVGEWGGDDGTSIEFEIEVTDHQLGKSLKYDCTCIRCAAKAIERRQENVTG